MIGYYLSLARKNLFRNRRRTIITFLALAVGIWYFIILDSLLAGMSRQSIDNLINMETSHLRLYATGYWEKREEYPLDKLVTDPETALAKARGTSGVTWAASRLAFAAFINNGVDELPVTGMGIDPASDPQVFPLPDYLVEGNFLKDGGNGALLGKELADLMELRKGDIFTLRMKMASGAMQAIDLEVVGILETLHPMVNEGMVFLPLGTAQSALGVDGAVSEIDIRAVSKDAAPGLQKQFKGLPGVKAYTWQDLAQDFLAMMKAERGYDMIMLVLVFIIALVGVVNTVLLATLERTREIGMLKAMGWTGREILYLFMSEAGFLGAMGGLAGVVLAAVTEMYMVNVGLDYTALMKGVNMGFPITGIMYGEWNPGVMVEAFCFGILVSIVASILPARRAAQKDAAAALRGV